MESSSTIHPLALPQDHQQDHQQGHHEDHSQDHSHDRNQDQIQSQEPQVHTRDNQDSSKNQPGTLLRNRLESTKQPGMSQRAAFPSTTHASGDSGSKALVQPSEQTNSLSSMPHGFNPPTRRLTGPGGRSLAQTNRPVRWVDKASSALRHAYTKYSPSLTLENKGSIARDHLANERTYLAWLRSSLSLITVGVAITQLFRLQSEQGNNATKELVKVSELGRPLGGSFIALGVLFLWLGTSRYFHNQTVLSYGQFPASRGSVILATVTVMGVLLACFIIVILQGHTR